MFGCSSWIESHRPTNWKNFVCATPQILSERDQFIHRAKDLLHQCQSVILLGVPGSGKTTFMQLVILESYGYDVWNSIKNQGFNMGAQGIDPAKRHVLWLNATHNQSIHDVRSLIQPFTERIVPLVTSASSTSSSTSRNNIHDEGKYQPHPIGFNTIVIDEADHMSEEMQTGLRRILEENADHVLFVFICNTELMILPLHSRCKLIRFPPLTSKQIQSRLIEILNEEQEEENKNGTTLFPVVCVDDISSSRETINPLSATALNIPTHVIEYIVDKVCRGDMRKSIQILQEFYILITQPEMYQFLKTELSLSLSPLSSLSSSLSRVSSSPLSHTTSSSSSSSSSVSSSKSLEQFVNEIVENQSSSSSSSSSSLSSTLTTKKEDNHCLFIPLVDHLCSRVPQTVVMKICSMLLRHFLVVEESLKQKPKSKESLDENLNNKTKRALIQIDEELNRLETLQLDVFSFLEQVIEFFTISPIFEQCMESQLSLMSSETFNHFQSFIRFIVRESNEAFDQIHHHQKKAWFTLKGWIYQLFRWFMSSS